MGGFESEKIMNLFNIDKKRYTVSLVIPFGYKSGKITMKARRNFDDVVKFVD